MKLVKAFAYGICSFALASAAWAGGGLHDKSASSSSSMSSESSVSSESSASTSSESTAMGNSSGAPWGAVQSDSSATGATRDSSSQSTEPELLSSEKSTAEQYSAMDDSYWTASGFSSSDEISLGG